MTQFPETRDSLLVQVQDPLNREAWDQFSLIYRPVIYRLARNRGLQDADAQDLAQQVLISVASAIGDWEKSNASTRFRHWLRRVTRNAIVNALTRRPKDRAAGGSSVQQLLKRCEPDHAAHAEIEEAYRRELYQRAAKQVRVDVNPETWQAFDLTMIQGKTIEDAASELNKSVGTIYASRSRVMRRLREAVLDLQDPES